MLTTVYVLQAQFIEVAGNGYNVLPGQYIDIEEKDAVNLDKLGQVMLLEMPRPQVEKKAKSKLIKKKVKANDTKIAISNSTGESSDKHRQRKKLSKNRRNGRRRPSSNSGKSGNKKTRTTR